MIALIGGNGSIGRRYQAILKSINESFMVMEIGQALNLNNCDQAIVATPTETHFEFALRLKEWGRPFLIEKPASIHLKECEEMKSWACPGYIVNNYEFLQSNLWYPKEVESIAYDFYNTGKDGLAWDLCQLIYMAKRYKARFSGKAHSPEWTMYINNEWVEYNDLEITYIDMIRAFIQQDVRRLMHISQCYGMYKAVTAVEEINGEISHEF